jgi:hypothetical protein
MQEDLVAEFEEYHSVRVPEWWPQGRDLLSALLLGRHASQTGLASAPPKVLETEPTFGVLCQLTERAYEHVAASVVCFLTKNAATAEVAARVAIESTVNIRFIMSGDRNSLLLAWLRAYVAHDTKQIDQWEQAVGSLPVNEKRENTSRIAKRRQVNRHRRDFLAQAEREFASLGAVDIHARWPSVADRFERIGESVAYRTTYARLSSQTHADAEETINYIVFQCVGDEELSVQMSRETIAFSEYLIAYGIYFYLLTMSKLCEAFCLSVTPALDQPIAQALARMHEIGSEWHW